MRIVQIIDSLEIGGAEKMAVNYANALVNEIAFSGLITTRNEGDLKSQIDGKVDYLFLKKKTTLDFGAAFRLRNYCKRNKVDILHCHSSSYFIALLAKIGLPNTKIIWHDHNGLSEFITTQKNTALQLASYFFSGIIVVNYQLKNWAERQLNCKKVIYLPNFTELNDNATQVTFLKGNDGKRILCLANLRPQKNHLLLLAVAKKCKEEFPDWSFHLVGKDFEDDYAEKVKRTIIEYKVQDTVFVYGSKTDIKAIINQSDCGVFTSDSEGLPVSLIEFGLLKKAVLSTSVGEIPLIINHGENGFLVKPNDVELFYRYLVKLLTEPMVREAFGEALYTTINNNNSKKAIVTTYLNWLTNNNE
jgi:glycosyltransferase involved in cell wall biosynthesis